MRNGYRIGATPVVESGWLVGRKPRARKRPQGAPTHVRSWPLRPNPGQLREIGTRFFTGTRVYNAVLGEFLARSRGVKSDPAWEAALLLPRRTPAERKARGAAFTAVEQAHSFTVDAAQSFASSLRRSWVREHLPAQETQNLGARAFDAVKRWHFGGEGKPRFKPAMRGLHSLAAADGLDRLGLEAANHGWLHRHDIDGRRGPAPAPSNQRGRRHPPTRRSVARINARRAAKRQSRSARTSTTNRPTALPT
jgi:hypothetical protein